MIKSLYFLKKVDPDEKAEEHSGVYNVSGNDTYNGVEYVLISTYDYDIYDIEVSVGPRHFTEGVTGSTRYLAFRKERGPMAAIAMLLWIPRIVTYAAMTVIGI